jgi:gas vesicle protein
MRSRSLPTKSGTSLLGLALGVAAGAAAALLVAPMRGTEMRATLRSRARQANTSLGTYAASTRSWAEQTWDRAVRRIEAARSTRTDALAPAPLTAPMRDIVATHANQNTPNWGA